MSNRISAGCFSALSNASLNVVRFMSVLRGFPLTLLVKNVAGDAFTSRSLAAKSGSTSTVEVVEVTTYAFRFNFGGTELLRPPHRLLFSPLRDQLPK